MRTWKWPLSFSLSLSHAPHKLYTLRIKSVNVETDKEEWLMIAYAPSVTNEKGPGGAERSRQPRNGILQRVLQMALHDLTDASHYGANAPGGRGKVITAQG